MRIIFSRKGFDNAAGKAPSPIIDGEPISPEAGMNIMRKAVAKNDLAKLKTRRKRINNVRSK
jgi:hypothetical protein